jgi:hypothetical protein
MDLSALRLTSGAHAEERDPLVAGRPPDLLFILSRVANTGSRGGTGDVLWVPGGEHGGRGFQPLSSGT